MHRVSMKIAQGTLREELHNKQVELYVIPPRIWRMIYV